MLTYYYNGNIITMDSAKPVVPHMVECQGKVLFCDVSEAPLGLDFRSDNFARAKSDFSKEVKFIDLDGKTVIPGLCDAHAHFMWWGLALTEADLTHSKSEADCIEILKNHAASLGKNEWVLGRGWTHNLWEKPVLPTRDTLDEVFPDNPVFLCSKCGHVAWVNTKALDAAGIANDAVDPDGGEFERSNGKLTGILKELAMHPVAALLDEPTPAQWDVALDKAQKLAHSLGLTSMHTPEDLKTWKFLQKKHAENALTMRINFWIPVAHLDAICDGGIRNGLGDNRLRITSIKMFADGSLGGRTAEMYDCYENEPDNFGVVVHDEEAMTNATMKANRAGLSMAIHAIGDKAVGNVISAYEKAAAELGSDGDTRTNPVLRNRIEHLQVFSNRDFDRLQKLKPIVSFQPIHLCADMVPADRYWGARASNAYACRTIAEAGCMLVFGSEVPVFLNS